MKFIKNIYLLFSFIFLLAFSNNEEIKFGKLSLLNKFKLQIPEPSGLAFTFSKKHLQIVSDHNSKIYKIDFSGNIINEKNINGIDLEGVTLINDSTSAVISEKTREIFIVDNNYNVINIIKTGISGKKNSGFEGITFVPAENIFLIANEKNPTVIYKISLSGKIISEHKIDFANDISGLFYDFTRNHIWILSEASSTIYYCDMNFKIKSKYKIPDDQIEGITVNKDEIFLVSDKSETLYHFKIAD